MKERRKGILIFEYDDFLREILGNLLHKKGYYIVSSSHVKDGIELAQNHPIDFVILGESCPDFQGKSTVNRLKMIFGNKIEFLLILQKRVHYISSQKQMILDELSIQKILNRAGKI